MDINSALEELWKYLKMGHKLMKADGILVFGSHDTGTAGHAVKLYKNGWAPLLIFSGGLGKITRNKQKTTEAERFARLAQKKGVPLEDVLIENKSTNTRENVIFTKELLDKKNIKVNKIIIIAKPYMERRAYATFRKSWKNVDVIASSQDISMQEYLNSYPKGNVTREDVISLIVGDLNRILVLPEKGLQVKQVVPEKTRIAYNTLVEMGYTKYLWK